MNQRFVLTGGPGSGKTTTLQALRSRGFTCVPDVARQVIQERLRQGLSPRPEPLDFAEELLNANIEQYDLLQEVEASTFFDFGIVESLLMLKEIGHFTETAVRKQLGNRPYNRAVFFFQPWKEIYAQDSERDQTFLESVAVSNAIKKGYESLGFTLATVPFAEPDDRADFILSVIGTLPV